MVRQYCCEVIELEMTKNYDSIIKQFDATVDITQTANEDIKDFKIFGEILKIEISAIFHQCIGLLYTGF